MSALPINTEAGCDCGPYEVLPVGTTLALPAHGFFRLTGTPHEIQLEHDAPAKIIASADLFGEYEVEIEGITHAVWVHHDDADDYKTN